MGNKIPSVLVMERTLHLLKQALEKFYLKFISVASISNFQPAYSAVQYRHYINLLNNINTLPQSDLTN